MVLPRLTRTLLLVMLLASSASSVASSIWVLELRGAVGPASADYLVRGMAAAEFAGADLVVLRMDTPGGLDSAMRQIIKAIIASTIPIATYVAPGGSRAASAGTYILYASHIAAMAPATNLGAATPVQIGAPSFPSAPKPAGDEAESDESVPASTAMERKIINDAVAYIRGLADLHGRNVAWAEKAVREAASLSAGEALNQGVIDIVAIDIDDLLRQAHGRSVKVAAAVQQLNLSDPMFTALQPDWRNAFLTVITDPNVAYLLMMIGVYGLILEAYNPGTLLPGIVGSVSLLLALYAFQVLPVSYAGLALIALGVMLMVAEAFAPSFGVLGLGGISAFVFGSIILMDTDMPAFQISLPLILSVATASAALLILLLGVILRARQQQMVSGLAALEGKLATVETLRGGTAMVRLQGELWELRCSSALQAGDTVRIVDAQGVILEAQKILENPS
jgi:membrane-bound serine protease (ClpP class)